MPEDLLAVFKVGIPFFTLIALFAIAADWVVHNRQGGGS